MAEKSKPATKSKKGKFDPRMQLRKMRFKIEKELGQVRISDQIIANDKSGDPADQAEHHRPEAHAPITDRARKFQQLKKLEAALDRIEQGTYGLCSECGEKINPGRLEVAPETEKCITCMEVAEKAEKLQNSGTRMY